MKRSTGRPWARRRLVWAKSAEGGIRSGRGGGLSGAEGKSRRWNRGWRVSDSFGAGDTRRDAVRQAAEELALSRNALYEASMAEKS